jgi:hypothetical protein
VIEAERSALHRGLNGLPDMKVDPAPQRGFSVSHGHAAKVRNTGHPAVLLHGLGDRWRSPVQLARVRNVWRFVHVVRASNCVMRLLLECRASSLPQPVASLATAPNLSEESIGPSNASTLTFEEWPQDVPTASTSRAVVMCAYDVPSARMAWMQIRVRTLDKKRDEVESRGGGQPTAHPPQPTIRLEAS